MRQLSIISLGLAVAGALSILGWDSDRTLLAQNRPRAGIEVRPGDRVANGRRVALVIGNADYTTGGKPLKNPVNDATDMAAAFEELGFDKVIAIADASLREMNDALNDFSNELRAGSVGVFYYAGHGMQSDGENYLIPVDADLQSESDIPYETLPLGKVLGRMEDAGNRLNIVILDACRDNPFSRRWRSARSQGLAEVKARGALIVYATAPGDVADDGEGRNGTFTEALLERIHTPGQDVELMLRDVRRAVSAETAGRQLPWTSSSLVGEFSFRPAPNPDTAQPSPPPQPPEPESPPVAVSPSPSPQPPEVSSRFRQLASYLEAGQWKEADQETDRVMLAVANRESEGWLRPQDIENLECEVLREIDSFWVYYSQGRFGLSVQSEIYRRLGGTREYNPEVWQTLAEEVEWRVGGVDLYRRQLNFSYGGMGHLPYLFRAFPVDLFDRAQSCQL